PSIAAMHQYGFLGAGPGTSQMFLLRNGDGSRLENSVLQMGVSIGIPGVAIFALLVLAAAVSAVRSHRYEALAGLIAYVTTAAGFNAWDSNPQTLGLFAMLLIVVFA